LSAPSRASKEFGEDLINDTVDRSFRIAEKALAGEDLSRLPVYPDSRPSTPGGEALIKAVQENYAQQTAEIEAWLEKSQTAK